jgi:hypothetical protein
VGQPRRNRQRGTRHTADAPRCLQEQLIEHLYGPETAFPGEGFNLTLTNSADQECSLYGYPGLGLEDASHHVLPSHIF